MAKKNGHDTDATSLSVAAEAHGGLWFNNTGSAIMQMQIAQVQAAREAQAKLVQLGAKRQIAIRALQAEADSAQADFVAAMKSSDYEQVAAAARRMTRAETALVNLGYYEDD
jgi:hypothetical protein